MSGELVQEGIGGGVVGLSRVAQNPGGAGKQREQIQVHAHGGAMETPRAEHLGPQDALKVFPALVSQRSVGKHADAVNHAGQRGQRVGDALKHSVHSRAVGDVGQLDVNPRAAFLQGGDGVGGRRVGRAASVEDDGAGAVVGQPAGHRDADAAETAGYQIGAVFPKLAGFKG